mmetsp:Transcript_24376/g.63548  ORF Transcript_24376/g.63548 Transcript_24376/m.63548 type:complete len:218 (-) Transcript_24376:171-824(-)
MTKLDFSWCRFIPKKPPTIAPAPTTMPSNVKIVSAVMSRFLAKSSFIPNRSSALSILKRMSSSLVCTASASCRYDSRSNSTSSCCVNSSGEMGGSNSRGLSLNRLRRIMHMSSSSSSMASKASAVSRVRASRWLTAFLTWRNLSREANATCRAVWSSRIVSSATGSTSSQAASNLRVQVLKTASNALNSNGASSSSSGNDDEDSFSSMATSSVETGF